MPELCYLAKVASSVEMNQSGEWAWVQGSALKIDIHSHHAEVWPDLCILGKNYGYSFFPCSGYKVSFYVSVFQNDWWTFFLFLSLTGFLRTHSSACLYLGRQKYFHFHGWKNPVQLGCDFFVRNTLKIWELLIMQNQSLHKCKLFIQLHFCFILDEELMVFNICVFYISMPCLNYSNYLH